MIRLVVASTLLAVLGCSGESHTQPDLGPIPERNASSAPLRAAEVNPRLLRRFRPLRAVADESAHPAQLARIALGTMLFFDTRLSRHGDTSCNSCHALDQGGVDHRVKSVGSQGRIGTRNAPTIYNAAFHVAHNWDGGAGSLEEQAGGPLMAAHEMAMVDSQHVETLLRSIPGYVMAFATAFPGEAQPVDLDHATRAIAAFERTLAAPARWDRFLEGDRSALTAEEVDGLRVFSDVGCVQCHTGELVGGSMLQRLGLVVPWPAQTDLGRYAVSGLESDRMVFKVPTLRNVAITAPYFHDGSVAKLEDAIHMMAEHQIGVDVTEAEVTAIVAWLTTLTGQPPEIDVPVLPADGPRTAELIDSN